MPQETDHIRQARHNAQFLSTLGCTPYPDWAITVAFYTAIHLVEAHFARRNIDSFDHRNRRSRVSNHLQQIAPDYRLLENECRLARYECRQLTPADAARVLKQSFEPIRAQMCTLLGITL